MHLTLNFDVVRPGKAGLVDDRLTDELLEPAGEIGDRRRGQDDWTNRMKAIAPLEARELPDVEKSTVLNPA